MNKISSIPHVENHGIQCYNKHTVNGADSPEGEKTTMEQSETKICALYERLSRLDDDIKDESNSIKTQKQLLADYAESQGFTNIRHYTDDGTTGVRFDREAWLELIADVESGKISHIICKDMSRLGRDHVLVGTHLENFRRSDLRFIAVTNNIDSKYPETLEYAPFLNIMNEFYSRDISRKIMAAKRSNGRNGKYVSSFAPYGYKKSETEKGVWEIDPEAAEVVRRIFRMTIEGYGTCSIAGRLRKDKVHSPGYHMAQNGTGTCKNKEWEDACRWQGNMVDTIIGRMEYKGCMVNLKTQKQSFKDKRSKKLPREEWLVFEGKHEPIVDEATWQSANDIRNKKRRSKPDSLGEPDPLTGLMYCADCKSKMYHNRGILKDTGQRKNYYSCKESKKGADFCTPHSIGGDVVDALVLETLHRVIKYATGNEDEFTRQINEMYSAQRAEDVKSQSKRLQSSQKRHAELDNLIQRVYEDNVSGKINDNRFEILSNQYENEQAELGQLIAQIQTDLESFDDSKDRAAKFLALTRKYKEFSELTPSMLNELVDRIEVHERADKRYRITTQKVDIYLSFIGVYSPPAEAIEGEPELKTDKEYEAYLRKVAYMREYRKRRDENNGEPLGRHTGPRPDSRTPEQKAADEEARIQRLKEYHRNWYQNNKERMKAEKAEKRIVLTPEELAAKEENASKNKGNITANMRISTGTN